MKQAEVRLPRLTKRRLAVSVAVVVAVAGAAAAYLSRDGWLPEARRLLAAAQKRLQDAESSQAPVHEEPGEAGVHAGQNAAGGAGETSLELSEQAQKNVGLQLMTVQLQDFDRTISVPATVKDRQGRTEVKVSAPMTGIVIRIYPIRGEAVAAGQPLFDLRLTHEDLVDTQSTFLETVEQLDVIKREVARLEEVTSSGVIAGKRLLERQYEQQQAEARLHAQQQALILHGLTEQQVDEIETSRRLLQQVTVFAPQPVEMSSKEPGEHLLQVSQIQVGPGEQVNAGVPLCVLSDHAVLYIEGKAFEEDSGALNEAANQGSPITAVIEAAGEGPHTVSGLKILYVENEVELESRALRFYVRLPNELERNEQTDDGHRFIGWRFKPGQRVQLQLPVDRWQNRIVLPVDAVVKEGADWFVFRQNGRKFDRKPVHVEYRDQRWAVIENDGSLFPGDVVAASGAYQMHLAMKNKAGGGVDPHAGHNH
jgi:biotin carboxyl carrier protein